LIPGFDRGLGGMHVGGKRRVFIPYQLAYGEMGRPGPDATHTGIPPKADLIFDVELVDVTEVPQPPLPTAQPFDQLLRPRVLLPDSGEARYAGDANRASHSGSTACATTSSDGANSTCAACTAAAEVT